MIKKIPIITAIVAGITYLSVGLQAEVKPSDVYIARDLSTSGGKTITANIAATTGRRIVIWGLNGTSDKSGSVMTIQQANATGTTGNYTAKNTFAVGSAAVTLGTGLIPLYVGDVSYALRVLLDCTTKNNLLVVATYE